MTTSRRALGSSRRGGAGSSIAAAVILIRPSMADPPRLRSLLLRGALVTTANWPVVVAQFVAEAAVRLVAGIPLAGGAALLLVLAVPDGVAPAGATAPDIAVAAITALATVPVALAGLATAAMIAGVGGLMFGAVIKAGTVAVVVEGERRARPQPIGQPLRALDLHAARAWSPAAFMAGCAGFGARFVRLGLVLAAVEIAIAIGYGASVVAAYRGFVSIASSWWLAPALLASSLAAMAILSVTELGYRLTQLIVVADGVAVREALGRAVRFVRVERLAVVRIFVAALVVGAIGFVATLLAAAAFGFVSFVPVAGVAVLPLQAAVWVVRGLMFPFIELAALAAYAAVYRRAASRRAPESGSPESARPPESRPTESRPTAWPATEARPAAPSPAAARAPRPACLARS